MAAGFNLSHLHTSIEYLKRYTLYKTLIKFLRAQKKRQKKAVIFLREQTILHEESSDKYDST